MQRTMLFLAIALGALNAGAQAPRVTPAGDPSVKNRWRRGWGDTRQDRKSPASNESAKPELNIAPTRIADYVP